MSLQEKATQEQSFNTCLKEVKVDGRELQNVKDQTPVICLTAVKSNAMALRYVQDQTPVICLTAVRADGRALKYVNEQTPVICLAAIKERNERLSNYIQHHEKLESKAVNSRAFLESIDVLKYVETQTLEICIESVKVSPYSLKYVDKKFQPEVKAYLKQQRTNAKEPKAVKVKKKKRQKMVVTEIKTSLFAKALCFACVFLMILSSVPPIKVYAYNEQFQISIKYIASDTGASIYQNPSGTYSADLMGYKTDGSPSHKSLRTFSGNIAPYAITLVSDIENINDGYIGGYNMSSANSYSSSSVTVNGGLQNNGTYYLPYANTTQYRSVYFERGKNHIHEYTFTAYPVVNLTINVSNWDGSPYNGDITVSSNGLGTTTTPVTNGIGNIKVRKDTLVNFSTPLTSDTCNGYVQYIKDSIPATATATNTTANITAQVMNQYYTITAKESSTSEGISGIIYSAPNEFGNTVQATTDASGTATLLLPKKTQTITEASFPKGYKNRGLTFTMLANSKIAINPLLADATTRSVTYTYNAALDTSSLEIYLADSETGIPISGGRFEILRSGVVLKTGTTSSSGSYIYSGIDNGTYTVRQIAAPSGYIFDSDEKTIEINSNDEIISFENRKQKGNLNLFFTDSVTKQGIERLGVIIRGEGITQTLYSDENGLIALQNFSYGTYTLTEHEVPNGYKTKNLNTIISIDSTMDNGEHVYQYEPYNDASITVILTDKETGSPIRGGQFELLKDGTRLDALDTELTGKAVFSGLYPGTYTVKQIAAANHYEYDEPAETIVTINREKKFIEYQNTRKKGQFALQILDSVTNLPISNIGMLISGTGVNSVLYTDENGYLPLDGIAHGAYQLTEWEVTNKYKPRSLSINLTLDDSMDNQILTFKYDPYLSSVKLHLTDSRTGENIKGLRYEVINQDSGYSFGEVTLDYLGTATLTNLPLGNYVFNLLSEDSQYDDSINSIPFQLMNEQQQLIKLEAAPLNYSIKLLNLSFKDSITQKGIERLGVTIRGEGIAQTLYTDENGLIALQDFSYGTYTLTEYEVPNNYRPKNLNTTIVIDATMENGEYAYQYEPYNDASITVILTDKDTGLPIKGGQFELLKDGTRLDALDTELNGKAVFSGLYPGTYTIKQIAPASHYEYDEPAETTVTINREKKVVEYQNTRKKGQFALQILDSVTNLPISNIGMLISGTGVNSVLYTDENGYLPLDGIAHGSYQLTEWEVTNKYKPRSLSINLTLDDSMDNQILTFKYDPYLSSVKLHLTDSRTGENIKGLKYEVINQDSGYSFGEVTLDYLGTATLTNLPLGNYVFNLLSEDSQYDDSINSIPFQLMNEQLQLVKLEAAPLNYSIKLLNLSFKDIITQKGIERIGVTIRGEGITQTLYTDENGLIALRDFSYGTYTLTEHEVPNNYRPKYLNTTIVIDATMENGEYAYQYEPYNDASITVILTDKDTGLPIKGGQFELLKDGTRLDALDTELTGKAVFSGLYPGTYTIKQIAPASHYEYDEPAETTVTINREKKVVEYQNTRKKGQFALQILDSVTNLPISNIGLLISGTGVNSVLYTDENGYLPLDGIAHGSYQLTEWDVTSKYKPRNININLSLDNSMDNQLLTFRYDPYLSSAKLHIINSETGENIRGLTYEVLDRDGYSFGEVTLNALGTATISNLPLGDYTFRIITNNYQYSSNINNISFRLLNEQQQVIQIEALALRGNIVLNTIDVASGREIYPSRFQLRDSRGVLLQTIDTDTNGMLSIYDLLCGEYTLTEITRPTGYEANNSPISITLVNDTIYHTHKNEKIKNGLNLVVKDGDTQELILETTLFSLVSTEQPELTYNISVQGYNETRGIPWGTYILTQETIPEGYLQSSISDGLIVDVSYDTTQVQTYTIEHEPKNNNFSLSTWVNPIDGSIMSGNLIEKGITFTNVSNMPMEIQSLSYRSTHYNELISGDGWTQSPMLTLEQYKDLYYPLDKYYSENTGQNDFLTEEEYIATLQLEYANYLDEIGYITEDEYNAFLQISDTDSISQMDSDEQVGIQNSFEEYEALDSSVRAVEIEPYEEPASYDEFLESISFQSFADWIAQRDSYEAFLTGLGTQTYSEYRDQPQAENDYADYMSSVNQITYEYTPITLLQGESFESAMTLQLGDYDDETIIDTSFNLDILSDSNLVSATEEVSLLISGSLVVDPEDSGTGAGPGGGNPGGGNPGGGSPGGNNNGGSSSGNNTTTVKPEKVKPEKAAPVAVTNANNKSTNKTNTTTVSNPNTRPTAAVTSMTPMISSEQANIITDYETTHYKIVYDPIEGIYLVYSKEDNSLIGTLTQPYFNEEDIIKNLIGITSNVTPSAEHQPDVEISDTSMLEDVYTVPVSSDGEEVVHSKLFSFSTVELVIIVVIGIVLFLLGGLISFIFTRRYYSNDVSDDEDSNEEDQDEEDSDGDDSQDDEELEGAFSS